MTRYFTEEGPYLMHFGILGMKWGVRRYQNDDGSLTPEGRKRYRSKKSDDRIEYEAIKKKGIKAMSNAELKKAKERMRLEQENKRLSPSALKTGLKYAGVTAGALGTYTAIKSNAPNAIKDGKKFATYFFAHSPVKVKKAIAGADLALHLAK